MTPHNPIDPARMLLELDGYRYPLEYRWLRFHGFRGITPWRIIDDVDEATTIRKEFLLEVGGGSIAVCDLLPFARSEPADEFAGFVQSQGKVTGEVCVAHLTFRGSAEVSNYPTHEVYASLWEWLTRVFADTRELCVPRTLADLEASLQHQHHGAPQVIFVQCEITDRHAREAIRQFLPTISSAIHSSFSGRGNDNASL